MSTTTLERDWRKEPPTYAFEMSGPDEAYDATQWPATADYNRDRLRMARALDVEYIEVGMKTIWLVWAPEEAEARWRQDHCECEDGPHYPGLLLNSETGEPIPPEACATTSPAASLESFWDEDGYYCPWTECKPSTPGAVKFRRGFIR